MAPAPYIPENDQPINTGGEKDVLGLDKNPGSNSSTSGKAKPNRIFIGLAIIVALVVVYWFIQHR